MPMRAPVYVLAFFLCLTGCSKEETPEPTSELSQEEMRVEAPGASEEVPVNTQKPEETPEFREVEWQELVPESFTLEFIQTQINLDSYDIGNMIDGDPETERLYKDMQKVMREAPVIAEMDGDKVKIPGFVVPLDLDGNTVRNFLLVPYFGACIHTPPPPANQIVYVEFEEGFEFLDMYVPVWVSGPITVEPKDSELGYAGYTIVAKHIENYE